MLNHTKAYLKLIQSELSVFSFVANLVSSLFMIGYMTYSLTIEKGILWVNILLLSLATANLFAYFITKAVKSKKADKFRKMERHVYNISRIFINAVPLAAVMYTLVFTSEEISRVELVFLPLMILLWIFQASLELITLYLEKRLKLFADAIALDYEPIRKVINSLKGDSRANEKSAVSDKNRAFLTDIVEEYIEEKSEANEETEPVVKDGWLTRLSNVKSAVKELMKK